MNCVERKYKTEKKIYSVILFIHSSKTNKIQIWSLGGRSINNSKEYTTTKVQVLMNSGQEERATQSTPGVLTNSVLCPDPCVRLNRCLFCNLTAHTYFFSF